MWRYSAGTNQWSQCADLPGAERGGNSKLFLLDFVDSFCGGKQTVDS